MSKGLAESHTAGLRIHSCDLQPPNAQSALGGGGGEHFPEPLLESLDGKQQLLVVTRLPTVCNPGEMLP